MDGEVKVTEISGLDQGSNNAFVAGRHLISPSRLTWIRYVYSEKTRTFCLYHCECGNEVILRKDRVSRGETRSCGCLRKEQAYRNLMNGGRSINIRNRNGGGAKKGQGKAQNKGKKALYSVEKHPGDQRSRKKIYIPMNDYLDMLAGARAVPDGFVL
jgi:hypothetical protein